MNNDWREMLSGYVDDELSDDERRAFEQELARNSELQHELEEFRKLQEVTGMARYADLPDEVWEGYWSSLYRKTERGLGWIFMSVGAIILLGFGLFEVFNKLYFDPTVPLWAKLGISAASAGAAILLVSYGRERLFAHKRDRYSEVKK